jgi:hypothetical protein
MTTQFRLADAVEVLRRTPAVLRAQLEGLPDFWLRADEGEGTWSPLDVVGHLCDGEETDWIPRARILLAHGESRAFDPFDRTRHLNVDHGPTLEQRLRRFERLRAGSLAALESLRLSEADLDRPGRHPELGPVTLRQLLATWVAHDLDHLVQVSRVMALRYRDDAGPWVQYLRVLRD